MHKKIVIGLVSVILLGGIAFFLYWYSNNASSKPVLPSQENVNTRSPESGTEEIREAILMVEKGDVVVQRLSEEQVVKDSVALQEGDMVTTKQQSEAVIVFADDSIVRLSENTQLILTTINLEEEKEIDMMQMWGETWHKVTKVLEGERYTIRHGNTIAGVRGTVFDMKVKAKDKVQIAVMEDAVEVVDVVTKKSREVTEDLALLYDEGAAMFDVSAELYQDLVETDWYAYNEEADRILTELEESVPDLFEYYVDEEQLDLLMENVESLDEMLQEGIDSGIYQLENIGGAWWNEVMLYEGLPEEYLDQYEQAWEAYEEFLNTMEDMDFNSEEYDALLRELENMDWEEYNAAMEELSNMNINREEMDAALEELNSMNEALSPDFYDALEALPTDTYDEPVLDTVDPSMIELLDVPAGDPLVPSEGYNDAMY